jgi:hypothetical protein
VLDVRFGSPRPDDLCVSLRAPDGEVVFELREAVDALDSAMLASALELDKVPAGQARARASLALAGQ